jgi:predicted HicB family RNase H-like nuclease
MTLMTYKGYSALIEFDADDEIFFGKIAGIRDGVGFHADTVADLKKAFHEAVDDYIETCAKIGKSPQKPYSGNLMLRVDPMVHANAALAAEIAGKSLNQWGEEVLSEAARRYAPKAVATSG